LIWSVVVLSLSGVVSVAYIAAQLNSITDKVFFLSVITAFIAPTVVALLAILRTEMLNKIVNGHFPIERRQKPRPKK
jgi:hypothetical protein